MQAPIRAAAKIIKGLRPILSERGAMKMAPMVIPTRPELKTIPKFAGEIFQAFAITGAE